MEHLETEVCIVSASYAGLAAARSLTKAGRTVAVLEARNRVGGRADGRNRPQNMAWGWVRGLPSAFG